MGSETKERIKRWWVAHGSAAHSIPRSAWDELAAAYREMANGCFTDTELQGARCLAARVLDLARPDRLEPLRRAERDALASMLTQFHCGSEDDYDDSIPADEKRYCGGCVAAARAYRTAVRATVLAELPLSSPHQQRVGWIAVDPMTGERLADELFVSAEVTRQEWPRSLPLPVYADFSTVR